MLLELKASRMARSRTAARFFMRSPFLAGVDSVVFPILHNSTGFDKPPEKVYSSDEKMLDSGAAPWYPTDDK